MPNSHARKYTGEMQVYSKIFHGMSIVLRMILDRDFQSKINLVMAKNDAWCKRWHSFNLVLSRL
jgi:hypothetical protein